MNHKLYILIFILFSYKISFGQVIPQSVKYTVIYLDENKEVLINKKIGVKISLSKDTTDISKAVYIETHVGNTNGYGVLDLMLGKGKVVKGTFNTINWKDNYFVITESDLTGGVNYRIKTIQRIASVPYASNAGNAPKGLKGLQGDQGATGRDGINGEQGEQGEQGIQGEIGDKGNTGTKGRDGVDGTNGKAQNQFLSLSKTGDTLFLSNGNSVILPGLSTYNQGKVSSLNCGNANFTGDIYKNQKVDSVTFSINYDGGDGKFVSAQENMSFSNPGLSAKLLTTQLDKGSGRLIYQIIGTPTLKDPARFIITIGDQSCEVYKVVNLLEGTVNELICPSEKNKGNYYVGQYTETRISLGYLGGNGGKYDGLTIPSEGINGLNAIIQSDILEKGDGQIFIKITGTPQGSGTASFNINLGGKTCVFTQDVKPTNTWIDYFDCNSLVFNGDSLKALKNAINNTFTLHYYSNNTDVLQPLMQIPSNGVTGMVATLGETITQNEGDFIFKISGTPNKSGVAVFPILLGNASCLVQIPVQLQDLKVDEIDCDSTLNNGVLIDKTISNSTVFSEINYDGSNGGILKPLTVESTGVLGLTANVTLDTLLNKNGKIHIKIKGTPSNSGFANFSIPIGGKICNLNRKVESKAIVTTLSCDKIKHYGKCIAEDSIIGAFVKIPYSGASGAYDVINIKSKEDTNLILHLSDGVFTNSSDSLILQFIGKPKKFGPATFDLTLGGKTCTIARTIELPFAKVDSIIQGESLSTWKSSDELKDLPIEIAYKGGNGGEYSYLRIESEGVKGLVAVLEAGILKKGDGILTLKISGITNNYGDAIFKFNFGNKLYIYKIRIFEIDCFSAVNYGNLTSTKVASSVSSLIPYKGGNGEIYNGQVVASTGVIGLTATVLTGTFANGNGNLTYKITGTPTTGGIANFAINIGGRSCSLTRSVVLPIGIVSSLNCASSTNNGNLITTIATKDINSLIPYTGGNGGTYNGQVVASTGVLGLTASLIAGTIANGNGNLNYTITGTPTSLGTANFAINILGKTCVLTRSVNLAVMSNSITDIDGNNYESVQIGTQFWMKNNLKTSKYSDGTPIPNIIDNNQWSNLSSGAWSYNNNENAFDYIYGKLYNWYAVSTKTNGNKNVCPTGWHVPTDGEWTVLIDYLGTASVAGGKMKEVLTTYWGSTNKDATNSSLFSALPGGYRNRFGNYFGIGDYGIGNVSYWWSSTENGTGNAWSRYLGNSNGNVNSLNNYKKDGLSIRCIKD